MEASTIGAAIALTVLAACVAPMGVGAGPRVPERAAGAVSTVGGGVVGVAGSRVQLQAEASARLQPRTPFSFEAGMVYSALRDRDDVGTLLVHSAMPWVRPTLYVRGVSVGAALSGLGFGGGGGGLGYGMIEPRIGYGRARWSVHASWLRHAALAVGGDSTTEVSSQHWRLGADWDLGRSAVKMSMSAAITRGDDCFLYSPAGGDGTWAERYTMVTVGVQARFDGR